MNKKTNSVKTKPESSKKPKGFLKDYKKHPVWQLINDQYNREFSTAIVFFKLAAEADRLDMMYLSEFLKQWAKEELDHAELFDNYLASRDAWFEIKTECLNPNPSALKMENVIDIIDYLETYQAGVSDIMNNIAKKSLEHGDYPSFYFIEHFVKDQIIEEKKVKDLQSVVKSSTSDAISDLKIKKLLKYYYPNFKHKLDSDH